MPGVLTALAASVLAGVMTLSTAGCTTPPPEKPEKIPQVMWDLLWDRDQLKEADKTFYLNTYNGVDYTTYMFRSTNLYPLECDASGTDPADGYQVFGCQGKVPLPGTQYAPLLSPIPSTHLPTAYMGASTAPEPGAMSFGLQRPEPMNAYGKAIEVLPVGSKLVFPKKDPQAFKNDVEYYYAQREHLYNRKLVCAVPTRTSIGCIRSDNHGFYLDQYGTHTF
ncbi:hypothetical protein [Lawsonella clevelandensis]|uniref:hypothetical protein n=1 Tax=Lawsonella clevelandensis TaxID=1528099 RepID=UPI0023F1EF69|nr:hypothetical protein [Lawsonella clevelandensis]